MGVAPVLGPIGHLGDHAEQYADTGLEVFPVNPADKTPLISQHLATTIAPIINDWWKKWPTALIGHRIAVDQVLTDIDPRHNGDQVWRALRDEIGTAWPTTRAHASGRGDGGGHNWWARPTGKLSINGLNQWARERGIGEAHGTRWSCGIDLLHHDHRYTILPPSPHPETGDSYRWVDGRGLQVEPAEMPELLRSLLIEDVRPAPIEPNRTTSLLPETDSIADWYTNTSRWAELLPRHGWTLVHGNGDDDGSQWRHPSATTPVSATITHHNLFVYSPNTPFEPTEQSDPHGYTLFRAYAVLEHHGDLSAAAKAAREARGGVPTLHPDPHDLIANHEAAPVAIGPQPIDWQAFWVREHIGEDWLVHPILPRGRQVALWARHKTGKSLLTLEIAAALATGRPCLTQSAGPPIPVIYLDMEMTEDDLHERLTDLGYGPQDDLSLLHYYLLPSLPPLDTAAGGYMILELARHHHAQALVIDTMARAVAGDENDADTYRAFYRHTGLQLKAMGISVLRLDHGGKDATKGQRGSSGKGDDVDVVWQLKPLDNGLQLVRDVSRMAWVPEKIALTRHEQPLRHVVTDGAGFVEGTAELAQTLLDLGATAETTNTKARALLKAAGRTAGNKLLSDAVRHLPEAINKQAHDLISDPNEPF